MNRQLSASFSCRLWVVLGACACLALPSAAWAGGGPENVLLVVNRNSTASMTIANHYIQLRQIPPGNVLTLPFNPKAETTDIDTFRQQILLPVLTAIKKRKLESQIDYIVYSSDFPWGIDLQHDVDKFLAAMRQADQPDPGKPPSKVPWPKIFTPTGSINGLTYLWQPVVQGHPGYLQLKNNFYMRQETPEQNDASTLSFQSSRSFGPHGELVNSGGASYLLSMMLGVTAGRGNTVDEVLEYLRRSASADGTHPRGTIYFVENGDVRSKVRHAGFPAAVRQLKALGVHAEIVEGKMPVGKSDVQGAMLGTATFDWKSSLSTILPGALCDHFTSFGGLMVAGADQTPLSEFLRYGAAGASGTVREPFALAEKFAAPAVQVHYARGCTLAEAFYQSVYGPYQLLIVGDPLCRPWANIPEVAVEGIQSGAEVQGQLTLTPSAVVRSGGKFDRFELFIDGWRRTTCGPGQSLEFDTRQIADGWHELRVVAVEAGNIGSQGRRILSMVTHNHGRSITTSAEPQQTVTAGKPLTITANSPGASGIAVLHDSLLLGTISGESGRLQVDSAALGYGPVRLQIVGMGGGGPLDYVTAPPLGLTVQKGS